MLAAMAFGGAAARVAGDAPNRVEMARMRPPLLNLGVNVRFAFARVLLERARPGGRVFYSL